MHPDELKLRRTPRDEGLWRQAQAALLAGRFAAAGAAYRELSRRYGGLPLLWFELGNAAAGELDFPTASEAYRRARELGSRDPNLLVMLGQQFQGLRQLDEARACFEQAVAVAPDSVDAQITLAVWSEKVGQLDTAWAAVNAILARQPRDDQARYFRALLLHRAKRNDEAETALRDLLRDGPRYPYVKYAAPHLLGVVLDQLGRCAEAFDYLLQAKAQVRTITDTRLLERNYDETAAARRQLLAGLTPAMIRRWRAEPPAGGALPQRLVFLGGHPRSGTTLLEQVLDANPAIHAFDESTAFLHEVEQPVRQGIGVRTAAQLDTLSVARREQIRTRYVQSLLREVTGPPRPVLVDKNPSPTLSLNLWLRIFPELKVIIALRDPRDVVLSCFFLNIMLNVTNVNFLSLERTARHYADLMDVWLRLRELGGFEWLESRYEEVVQDLPAEGRRVMDFIGLPWHEDQGRSHETARRKLLYAPTYHDVTQPVYRRAVGRWERYADRLAPVRQRLAPYVRAFGYVQ